ncbi:hypothetical protein Mame01_70990 [Microbispora amethystogenes]|nr:hypothetical protein Mame01_70990 [Microbispora amethystogenes]
MVLADSHRISRAPCYSGTLPTVDKVSPTRLSRSTAALPRAFDYPTDFSLPEETAVSPGRSHNPAHATPAGYHTRTV